MLDIEHEPLEALPNDQNAYFYGSIGGHNVVICSLPGGVPGKVSAAIQAESLKKSFNHLRMCLYVGIGGGVPYDPPQVNPDEDIHLGDVVVGWPDKPGVPAVVQYDLLRRMKSGVGELLGIQDKPDRHLLNALGSLLANHVLGKTKFGDHLVRVSHLPGFKHLGATKDNLFQARYRHDPRHSDCSQCDPTMLVPRKSRDDTGLKFHQSTILSGDTVMKDARERDRLSKLHYGARCFEMEAAGAVGTRSTLVIRGISDYSDSHKNSAWQSYAAATAAAFGRELLYTVQPLELEQTDRPDTHPVAVTSVVENVGEGLLGDVNLNLLSPQDAADFNPILLPQLFPVHLVKLGQFLPYPLRPTIDSFDPSKTLHLTEPEDYIAYPPFPFEVLMPSDRKRSHIHRRLLSRIGIGTASEYIHLKSDESVYRTLTNSNAIFKKACSSPEARSWLQTRAMRSKSPLYFVVGLQVLKNPIIIRSLRPRSSDSTNSPSSTRPVAVADAKRAAGIVGIEVRRVEYNVRSVGEPILEEDETMWNYTFQRENTQKGTSTARLYQFSARLKVEQEDVFDDVVREDAMLDLHGIDGYAVDMSADDGDGGGDG
ncbi:hypothetical protein MMC10_004335 [Thelotrema lepadinum]|nr:hypothetical protein [Thelotrema lepadinum]